MPKPKTRATSTKRTSSASSAGRASASRPASSTELVDERPTKVEPWPELEPWAPGIRAAVGLSRSGKTYWMKRSVERASERIPVIVIDRIGTDWTRYPADVAPRVAVVSSMERAIAAADKGRRLIVVRTKDVAAVAEQACAWARDRAGVAGVAVPEAHRAFPNTSKRLPEPVEDCVCAWAHHNVALWVDSQRFAKLHKDITEQAAGSELRLFAILGARDRASIAEDVDAAIIPKLDEIRDRWQGGRGERGWHVRLPSAPPYALERVA